MSATGGLLAGLDEVRMAMKVVYTALALTNWQYPPQCTLPSDSSVDYIIVGGGSAGSVLGNRLSENPNITVAVLEAGGYPPIESDIPALFSLVAKSQFDFNFTAENDGYAGQNLQDFRVRVPQGKMLGGSSGMFHLTHTQGNQYDYDEWGTLTGDSSWNYENIIQYFRKSENLLVQSILDSPYAKYHGTAGNINITKEPSEISAYYFEALKELGHEIREDLSGEFALGFSELLLYIADGKRQNAALNYLGPVKSRPNLCVSINTMVKKINITDNVATGVEMVDSNGNEIVLNANKEVIVSAGVINSPKLLMLSGVGPKEELEKLGIEVIADLPVGENLQDHQGSALAYQMEASDAPSPPFNPYTFPVPAQLGYVALDPEQTNPDYQAICLVFPHDMTAQIQMCSVVFNYKNEICDKFYAASAGRTTYMVPIHVSKPKSRGKVVLTSADYTVDPKIYSNTLNDTSDLQLLAKSLENFNRILNTTYFIKSNASLIDVGVCTDSGSDFWECYALSMSTSLNHMGGTCAMGSVLDSELRVKGVNKLRVVDASSMVTIPSGEIHGGVIMLAEKASELILAACD